MSFNNACDPAGTIVHTALRIPALGAALCIGAATFGYHYLVAEPDSAGNCETGQPATVSKVLSTDKVCVVVGANKPNLPVVTPVPVVPIIPAKELPPAVPIVEDQCKGARVITDADLFKVTGKPFLWKRAGADPVRGHATEPFLRKLGYTDSERAVFLAKIAADDSVQVHLKNGDNVGLSSSGSGKMSSNTVVAFNPVVNTGKNYAQDARMNVYMQTEKVIYNGNCVERTVTLYEPLVCQNWSRPSDGIRILHTAVMRREEVK